MEEKVQGQSRVAAGVTIGSERVVCSKRSLFGVSCAKGCFSNRTWLMTAPGDNLKKLVIGLDFPSINELL